jgi:hypothetical protein
MAVSANHISHNPIDHHKVMFLLSYRTLIWHLITPSSPTVTIRSFEQRVGYTIITLYTLQLLLGILIHTVRTPSLFILHRPPQNYLHAAFGFTIFVMAGCQVRTLPRRLPLELDGGLILI